MRRHLAALTGLLLAVLALTLLPLAGAAQAAGDDYPYKSDTTQQSDPWGFTKRQCVSFAAWRLDQRDSTLRNSTEKWGNAADWDNAARRLHYGIGNKPVVGATAQWNEGERSDTFKAGSSKPTGWMKAGSYGHVGTVKSVNSDGTVTIENYNMGSAKRSYSTLRTKAPRYLYIGVTAPR